MLNHPTRSKRSSIWLLATNLVVFIYYAVFSLRSSDSPRGDGPRVKIWVEKATASDWFLPSWDPYSNLGQYVLSDPERYFYFLAAPVFAIIGLDNFNLTFNLLLILSVCAIASASYLLLRSFGLVASLAAVGAITCAISDIIYTHHASGRLNGLVNIFFMLCIVACHIRWKVTGQSIYLVIVILSLGIVMVLGAYYVLAPAFLIFVNAIVHRREAGADWLRAMPISAAEIFLLSSVGLVIFIPVLFPLVLHNTDVAVRGYERLILLPDLSTLPNIFVPITSDQKDVLTQVSFPHISIFLIFGLALVRPKMLRQMNAGIYAYTISTAFFLIISMGFFLPKEVFQELYKHIPLISELRHSFIFMLFAGLGLIALAMWGLQERFPKFRDATLGLKLGVIALVVVAQTTFLQRDFKSYRLTNEADYPAESGISERLAMERVYCFPLLYCPPRGVPEARGIVGFSNNFLEQQKIALSLLIGREIEVTRPHWIGNKECRNLRQVGIEMTGLRFAVCRKDDVPPAPFEAIWTSGDGRITTYEYPESPRMLPRAFSEWSIGTASNGNVKAAEQAWLQDKVLLDHAPDLLPARNHDPNTALISLEALDGPKATYQVTISEPALIVFPEIDAPGWNATVDGVPIEILRAFGSYRALSLPAGTHLVHFHHHDPYLAQSLWIWVFGLLVLLTGLVAVIIFRRRPRAARV